MNKVKTGKQKNNHARAKRRIKLLKLKNFCKRVIENRAAKIAKLKKPKGKTLVGEAAKQIPHVTRMRRSFYQHRGTMNQRQKRKLWRQAPHMRKRA
jgi:hypothetical protein